MLKQGQTINIGGRWGTITYLVGDREAVVTLDDDRQTQVDVDAIELPAMVSEAQGLKPWREVPEGLVQEARVRRDAGEGEAKVRYWLVAQGYDVQWRHMALLLGSPVGEELA